MLNAKQTFLYGLFFSAITVLFWGMLPIALKLSGDFSDPITLTWLRFCVAGLLLGTWQWLRGQLQEFRRLSRQQWLQLFAAGSFLIINYTCFAWSLSYMLPGSAQLSFQSAPLFLALGGLFFLQEKVNWQQWLCFAGIGLGMLTFFHPILGQADHANMWLGFFIIQISASAWSCYALLQKSLFKYLSPSNILLAIYAYASIVMLPFSRPSDLAGLSNDEFWIAAFCCLNTLIAYGAFAQAMRYWQTVQVSASVALTPVMAFILTELVVFFGWWTTLIESSHADVLSLFGMFIVILCAIKVQLISTQSQRANVAKSTVTNT